MAITELDRDQLITPLQVAFTQIEGLLLDSRFDSLHDSQDGYLWLLDGATGFTGYKSPDPLNPQRIIRVTATGSHLVILRWQGRLDKPAPHVINNFVDTQIVISPNGDAWDLTPISDLRPTMTQAEAEAALKSLTLALGKTLETAP